MKRNIAFFVFMYALGIVTAYAVLPETRNAKIYEHLFTELFVDVGILFLFLSLLPRKISLWVKRLFYVIAYAVALIDVCCFVKFDSTLTPTMLLLVGETNGQEATEFLRSYLSADILFSKVGWVLLVLVAHGVWSVISRKEEGRRRKDEGRRRKENSNHIQKSIPQGSKTWKISPSSLLLRPSSFVLPLFSIIFLFSLIDCWQNKVAFHRLMTYETIGDVEHELTEKNRAVLYQPLYRLAFSIRANQLTAKQVNRLIGGIDKVQVDSCAFTTPHIVLIIGESYNRHHAQLYGYDKATTPRQVARSKRGELVAYQDVVAPWNLTSFVFKLLFSLYTVGDQGEWCDYPLFPEVFRQAGYHVTFLTNQFLPQAKEAVYDFSGGFFLNNPTLSKAMFDTRNDKLWYYDEGMLKEWDDIRGRTKEEGGKMSSKQGELTIVHLKGQHLDYRTRSPKDRWHFKRDDYDRPDLRSGEIQRVAYYDNAILYNDSIVDQLIQRVEKEKAVVIYVPDHGEECYGPGVHFCGRMHSTEITYRLAHEEFDIPFWIWCSRSFRIDHPELYETIVKAKNRRYMTDALPFLLMHLAGISSKDYRPELDILSTEYREQRPRILKNTTDYDKLEKEK
ncbi:MAG: phosphoethanolamine transferase [Prevotella sp.]|nr:phosphoethanolamine transferase [Prevotella sp.]